MKNLKIYIAKIYFSFFPRKTYREEILQKVMRLVSSFKIKNSDYLEFGVYRGDSIIAAYNSAQKHGLDKIKFYAFDSFEGLPPITGIDNKIKQFSKGKYTCTEEKFRENIAMKGVNLDRVTSVPGWYSETLNNSMKKKLPIKSAGVIWIDCDLYESTVSVLNFITDYVVDGTIIIFDDWFCFHGSPQMGEQRAFREWIVKNPSISFSEYMKSGFCGNSFILHRK